MFGTFRLVLAALVIWQHFFGAEFSGSMAVFGFYCLSGYLMTMVINGPYADGLRGFLRYLGNRALRIYPLYFVVVTLVAAAMLLWPASAGVRFDPEIFDPRYLLPSITIIGLFPLEPTFVGPAWTLNVELLHYIAIGALLGRSRLATVLWFAAALDLRIFGPVLSEIPLHWFYWSPVGSSLAFASGAMIWHFRSILPASNLGVAVVASALFVLWAGLFNIPLALVGGLNVGLVFAAVAIIALRELPAWGLDRFLGDLAYPVYLLHVPVGEILRGVTGETTPYIYILAVAVTLALAYFMIAFIERPIERVRRALRRPSDALPGNRAATQHETGDAT